MDEQLCSKVQTNSSNVECFEIFSSSQFHIQVSLRLNFISPTEHVKIIYYLEYPPLKAYF